jgi:hypothetical protein
MENLIIMRVGEFHGNFKRAVVDRMKAGSDKIPKWAINSKTMAGGGSAHALETLERYLKEYKKLYILFRPNKREKYSGNLYGLAEITGFSFRVLGPLIAVSDTNEELGCYDQNAYGDDKWDIEFEIKKFWNLEKLNSPIYDYHVMESKAKLHVCSVHLLTRSDKDHKDTGKPFFKDLNDHLNPHIQYIIKNFRPDYVKK